jgi:hypothetical protein
LQDTPKFTQIWIFDLKIYHLATLAGMTTLMPQPSGGDQNKKERN